MSTQILSNNMARMRDEEAERLNERKRIQGNLIYFSRATPVVGAMLFSRLEDVFSLLNSKAKIAMGRV